MYSNRLRLALIITLAVGALEVIGGILSNSLALISDSLHVFTDSIALAVALVALRLALRPHTPLLTYGYHRIEVLAAFINLAMLSAVSVVIIYEAYKRVIEPVGISWNTMLTIGIVGLAANIIVLKVVGIDKDKHLVIESARLHILNDILSSIGVVAASIVISVTSLYIIDILVSIGIVGLIIRYVVIMIKRCVVILLEGAPEGIDVSKVMGDIYSIQGIVDVHDLHVWSIAPDMSALSVHVIVKHGINGNEIIKSINDMLASKYGIKHTTIQVEVEDILRLKPGSDSQVVRQPRDQQA